MQPAQSNVYVNLQRLVWVAFAGVLSFQVLAPNVWSHVSQVLGFTFSEGYKWFVLIYALTVLIVFCVWLAFNGREIRDCLFPVGIRNEMTLVCGIFLLGLMVSIVIQGIAIAIFLTRFKIGANDFVNVQWVILILNIVLLLTGIRIAIIRIHTFRKTFKNQRASIVYKKAYRTLLGWILVVLALCVFGFSHWSHNQKSYYPGDSNTIEDGFKYFKKRSQLDSLLKIATYKQDSLKTFIAIVKFDTASVSKSVKEQISLTTIVAFSGKQVVKTSEEKKSPPVDKKDTLKLAISIQAEYDKLVQVITLNRDHTLKSGQKIIGQLLRDHQLKLTYLFLNIFIILISLYVFLRVDFLIKEYGWEEADRQSKLYPNALEFKETFFKAEDTRRNSVKLSTDIWLYITLAIWLLVPLFKPIEDDKIDPKAPFKMLTLSGPNAPWEKWVDNSQDNDTNVDSSTNTVIITELNPKIIIQLQTDVDTINRLLKTIATNTDILIDKNDKLINKTDTVIKKNDELVKRADRLIVRSDTLIHVTKQIRGRLN